MSDDTEVGRPVTNREIRSYVRQRAREAAVWQEFEARFGDVLDLERRIAAARAELAGVETEIGKAAAALDASSAEAAAVVASARQQAEEIVADGNREAAALRERAAQEAQAVLDQARKEADRQVGRQSELAKATDAAERKLAGVETEIETARQIKLAVEVEVEQFRAMRTELASEIEALKKRFA